MNELFFIWSPRQWAAYCRGSNGELPIATRCQHFARQEYGCGLIVTTWQYGTHVPIKPVTIN